MIEGFVLLGTFVDGLVTLLRRVSYWDAFFSRYNMIFVGSCTASTVVQRVYRPTHKDPALFLFWILQVLFNEVLYEGGTSLACSL